MSSMTGIELGPDYCVLVRARRRGSSIELAAVRVFEADEWTIDLPSRTALLHDARRELGLPRHATVVVWDLPAFAISSSDTMLQHAGFTVDDVLSPSDALALLAWFRPQPAPDVAIAWLSINRHGAALSVVREHDLLYAREFAWRIRASEQRAQAQLLRRYLYVAQLVPEIRTAVEIVREQRGATVETALACGNTPDLRSFTIPLIEQLDIEFETLDSLEGLRVSGELAGKIAQAAPMIRLASAAAAFGASDIVGGPTARWLRAPAGLMLATGAAWWAFSAWSQPVIAPADPPRDQRAIVSSQGRAAAASVVMDAPALRTEVLTSQSATAGNTAEASPILEPVAQAPRPQPTTGTVGSENGRTAGPELQPVPTVEGILISEDRRLAVINGVMVGIGERVGSRIVARIDVDAVLFREASGRLVRVQVRERSR